MASTVTTVRLRKRKRMSAEIMATVGVKDKRVAGVKLDVKVQLDPLDPKVTRVPTVDQVQKVLEVNADTMDRLVPKVSEVSEE